MKTEEEINKKISTLFTDFVTKFIDIICKQILKNESEGCFWITDYQVKEITKQLLEEIKGDEG